LGLTKWRLEVKKIPQVFLSYVRQDQEKVEEIYRRLLKEGYRPWMDREDVVAGEQWRPKIEKAIHESDFFLACLSEHSVSRRGFLQTELKKGLEVWREKLPDDNYLIPVRLRMCEVPESLNAFQWVDIHEPGGWAQLLRALRRGSETRGEPKDAVSSASRLLRASFKTVAGLVPARAGGRRRRPRRAPPLLPPATSGGLTDDPDRPSTSNGSFNRNQVTAVKNLKPVPAADLPDSMKVSNKLPMVTFPEELERFLRREDPALCESLDEMTLRFVITLGTKLEPIVQVTPPTAVPLIIGFENLSLGSLGENFSQICERASRLNPGLLRLLVTLAAMKTTAVLRVNATQNGFSGVWRLLFTINLDPEMLDCPALDGFLERHRHYWKDNVVFEVNEKTTTRYLRRLKELQVDHQMRFCADDYNDWEPEVKKALRDRVEMSKVDYKTFRGAMEVRGDDPEEAVRRIAAHRIAGKPLIIEGVENPNYMRFLHEHWPCNKYGQLFGQGYIIEPGRPWDTWTADLRSFGLPGGHFLTSNGEAPLHAL
jgi:hypothetical protein